MFANVTILNMINISAILIKHDERVIKVFKILLRLLKILNVK